MSNIEGFSGCSAIRPLSQEEIAERKKEVYSRDLSEPFCGGDAGSKSAHLGTSTEDMPRGRLEYDVNNFEDVSQEKGPMNYPFKTIGQPAYDEPYNPNDKLYSPELRPNEPIIHSPPAYVLNREVREEKDERKRSHWYWILAFIIIVALIWFISKRRQ